MSDAYEREEYVPPPVHPSRRRELVYKSFPYRTP